MRADGKFGSLPFGWHAGAAWMFKDFGGFDDIGHDGAHADLEGTQERLAKADEKGARLEAALTLGDVADAVDRGLSRRPRP